MVFYFSGTGNSRFVAFELAKMLELEAFDIANYYELYSSGQCINVSLPKGETLVFVSPVHSWGMSLPMKQFVKNLELKDFTGQKVIAVFTCGDTCGRAREQIVNLLKKKNIGVSNVYCVQMPNTYIVLKGFGIDSEELKNKKLRAAKPEIERIVADIKTDCKLDNYIVGTKPFLKGAILYPLFMKFMLGDKKFFTDENCISCGLCEKVCPQKNIILNDGHPKWLGRCVKCLSCIHRCPKLAIQFGDITQSQGRYYFGKQ